MFGDGCYGPHGCEDAMGVGKTLLLAGAVLALLFLAVKAFPAELLARAGFNAAVGLAALFLLNAASSYTGVHLGINVPNLLVAAILGAPGLGLLLLAGWVLAR